MAALSEIVVHLDSLLEVDSFDDHGPNGLQVPGPEEVGVVATGVSAHVELFERAAAEGAQLVLCHHGLFWGSGPGPIDRPLKRRLQALFAADIALAAYHLPLDAHPTLGNNALICSALGLEPAEPFGVHRGRALGFVGRSADGMAMDELVARCTRLFGRTPLAFDAGPERVQSVGIVSGGGGGSLTEAIELGLDAFLTGEPEEPAMALAREGGINFLACGHHATETLGIRHLGEEVSERFGVRHVFIDVPNPV